MVKPCETLSVCLCLMDVSDCARIRPPQLTSPVERGLWGRVCKAIRESRRRPVARDVPSMCTAALSATESESIVTMNGRSETHGERVPRGVSAPESNPAM